MLTVPQPLVPDDDGRPDPAVAAALAAFQAGTGDAAAVVSALSAARLLMPVVALLTAAEVGAHGVRQDKKSEMAMPKLVGKDGREAVIAFTGVESLARWRPDARPIQASGPQVCQAAVQEKAAAVVIDVAGPITFVIEGPLLHALAAVPGGADEVARAVAEATGSEPSGAGTEVTVARLSPVRRRRFPWSRRS